MRTLFIADLHLSSSRPDITQAFNDFLDTELVDVEALYILGDLFEVWVGDDFGFLLWELCEQFHQAAG